MEKSENIKNFDTYEPQVLRKSEITRVLNNVKHASFNAQEKNNSLDKNSFKKRSLLDIALDASSQISTNNPSTQVEDKNESSVIESPIEEGNKVASDNDHQINEEKKPNDNFDEENKKQLIEQNNALIDQRIKDAEETAFQKGKLEGLTEGHSNGISEARSQSQQGLDAAISIFRIAAETIDSSDQANLDILNDTVQKTIIEIAQQSAGFMIDEFPQKFIERITEFSKLVNENFKRISLDINLEDYDAIKDFIQNDEFLSSINFKINKDLSRGDMKLNADGIRIDDLMKYGALDILNDIDKPDHETPLEEQSDSTVTQLEVNPNPETSLEEQSDSTVTQPEVNPNPETSTELKSTDDEKNE